MKAAVYRGFGPADVVSAREVPTPGAPTPRRAS